MMGADTQGCVAALLPLGYDVSPLQGSPVREIVGCAGTQDWVLGYDVPPLRGWGAQRVGGGDVLALIAAGQTTKGARTSVRSRCERARGGEGVWRAFARVGCFGGMGGFFSRGLSCDLGGASGALRGCLC